MRDKNAADQRPPTNSLCRVIGLRRTGKGGALCGNATGCMWSSSPSMRVSSVATVSPPSFSPPAPSAVTSFPLPSSSSSSPLSLRFCRLEKGVLWTGVLGAVLPPGAVLDDALETLRLCLCCSAAFFCPCARRRFLFFPISVDVVAAASGVPLFSVGW